MNHYTVLGVSRDADTETIHSAFRTLARRYHPDAGHERAPEKFHRLVEAYQTLSDPLRRQMYDRSLQPAWPERMIRPEPMTRPQWDPVFVEPLYSSPQRPVSHFDDLFDEILRVFEEDDFFSEFWRSRW